MATMTLDGLVSQLWLAFGDALAAVALYGSAARDDAPAPAATRKLNVLVLVDAITMETLAREAAIATAWADGGHPPPVTMTTAEFRRSADVFPIEYADLFEAHRVLYGVLPRDGVAVAPAISGSTSSTRRWGSCCASGAAS